VSEADRSSVSGRVALPFSAVVGAEDAKRALLLAAVQPRLAGVLLRGQKGSAKTTVARGLAALLPGDAPFVELPLGTTEDRLLGSLDLGALLGAGEPRFRPGLLADAHGGVLYVDEINLLPDHLVDVLLDVAVTGVNRVERDGVAHVHPARFVLVGSMNPEEGDLRPQLLDRFGLAVEVRAPAAPHDRAAAVRLQLDAEADPATLAPHLVADAELRARLAIARPAGISDDVVAVAARLALAVAAEGLRADLMLCRAAAALAGWDGRAAATEDDLRAVAPLVLAHRRRRDPFEPSGLDDAELERAFDEATQEPTEPPPSEPPAPEHQPEPPGPVASLRITARADAQDSGRRSTARGPAGRLVRDQPATEATTGVAVVASAVRVAVRRAEDPGAPVELDDLREAVREQRTGNLVVLVVDASASMGAQRRIAAAKGAVLGLLTDAYQRRDRVALIACRGERAEILLRPTGSGEIARARLESLTASGPTPLAHAIELAHDVATGRTGDRALEPLVVVVTDGRATRGGDDPVAAAHRAAALVARDGIPAVVVDAETGSPRLGLARDLATAMGAELVALEDLDPGQLERAIRIRLTTRRS
jgi:magnesium chelatase subunit D